MVRRVIGLVSCVFRLGPSGLGVKHFVSVEVVDLHVGLEGGQQGEGLSVEEFHVCFLWYACSMAHPSGNVKGFGPVVTLVHMTRAPRRAQASDGIEQLVEGTEGRSLTLGTAKLCLIAGVGTLLGRLHAGVASLHGVKVVNH